MQALFHSPVIPFLLLVWAFRTLGSIPQATYYWQLKEYRWDRMREFLIQQKGHQIFFSGFHVLMVLALLLAFFLITLPDTPGPYAEWFPLIIAVLLLAESIEFLHKGLLRKFKRPRLTTKALIIMGLTAFFELAMVFLLFNYFLWDISVNALAVILALLVLLDHDINLLAVFLTNKITNVFKRRLYRRARDKRLSLADLMVIGITGSFGKTSVKEFLSHILSKQFSVLKTDKNTNTEVGIAQTILSRLKKDHQIFVCEMGAYRIGEIKLCSMMARPEIGIFTGLNDQHLALFGSLNNTLKAKWELISSLPAEGTAIFNGDSTELRSRMKSFRGKSLLCSTSSGDPRADDIVVKARSISFSYHDQKFIAPLVGGFQVINVLMAIVAAEELGMSLRDIARQVKTLAAPEKTMQLRSVKKGTILDDSYNVNPDGLRAALSHLDLFSDQLKVIFFPGILELGENSEEKHEELGRLIGQHVDLAFFTDPHFSEPLMRGALKGGLTRNHAYMTDDPQKMIDKLKTILDAQDQKTVFLFESRGADAVMKWLRR